MGRKKPLEVEIEADIAMNQLSGYSNPIEKKLQTGYLHWDVQGLLAVLSKFSDTEAGAGAKIMMLLPIGRNPLQKEFNIKEIKLIENKIVGAKEKYRCAILVE